MLKQGHVTANENKSMFIKHWDLMKINRCCKKKKKSKNKNSKILTLVRIVNKKEKGLGNTKKVFLSFFLLFLFFFFFLPLQLWLIVLIRSSCLQNSCIFCLTFLIVFNSEMINNFKKSLTGQVGQMVECSFTN